MTAEDPGAEHLGALTRRICAAPERTALCLDFDGTLAPIVDDPASSALPGELAPVVAALAGRLRALALVSGRPAGFLAQRAAEVHAAGARLLGLYGMEEWDGERARPHPQAAPWQEAVDGAVQRLSERFGRAAGIVVEDKGLGVAVHWRQAGEDPGDRDAAGQMVEQAVREEADRTGLAVEPGKLVLELRPPVRWDKGDAVRTVAEESDASVVVYAGDDLGDVAAFQAVRALGGVAVAVDHGEETDPAVLAAGDVVLAGTDGVAAWLRDLLENLPNQRR